MKLRSLITLAFCLVLSTVALRAQEESRTGTDEEDARVATVAARQNAVTTLLASGDQSRSDDHVKAARAWNRAGRFQLMLNTPDDAITTYHKALDLLGNTGDVQTRVDSLNGLAAVYKHLGRDPEANSSLDQAILLS